MNIELGHIFLKKCYDLNSLLGGCNKISTFCKNLEKQAFLFPDRIEPEKYKGDGFELFVEALIKLSPVDNRIGITLYEVNTGLDTGVDGFGFGMDGEPAVVQAKYRGNSQVLLTANKDHLGNFLTAATFKFNVSTAAPKANRLIITTAKDLHSFTQEEMLYDKVRCINREGLRELVDNNTLFWDSFRDLTNLGG